MVLIVPLPASAYSLNGYHWGSSSLNWQDSNPSGTYSSTATGAGSAWSLATQVNLTRTTASSLLRAYKHDLGDNDFDGMTYYVCPFGALFAYANVTVNPFYLDSYSSAEKLAVWVHEFGHGLGLDHVASNYQMMYHCPVCVYSTHGYNTPQSDDIAGVNVIY